MLGFLRIAVIVGAVLLTAVGAGRAQVIERPADRILAYELGGATLAMSPAEARMAAEANGYEFVEVVGLSNDPRGWEYRKGRASLTISRAGEKLHSIALIEIARSDPPIDHKAEVAKIRDFFDIPEDAPACRATDVGGFCQINDGAEPKLFVTLQANRAFLNINLRRSIVD